MARLAVRLMSWNLKHGRADPSAGRYLLDEFARALAGWEWDVALLQEVPPWWPEPLARAAQAEARLVLTSRNEILPVRRALATRWPDLMKSAGGGANAILVRGRGVHEHRTRRLRRLPERRWMHALELPDGVWVGNLHASAHDWRLARRDCALASETLRGWAGDAPCILGGDLNLRHPELAGFTHAAGHDVDHVFVRGLTGRGRGELLDRGALSDHAPLVVTVS